MENEWGRHEVGLWPEIWGKESIGFLKADKDSSAEVLSGSGLTDAGSVDIIDTGEGKNLLGNESGNATGTSWCWDHSDDARTALSLNLDWDGMWHTDSGTPIASSDWDELHLGVNEGTFNGDLNLLGDLDTNTAVTLSVTGGDNSLESSSLSGLGLLLNGKDAHDLVGESGLLVGNESVDDWGFLDWDGVGIDFLELGDGAHLDKSSEFGEWGPFFLESTSATWATSSSSAAASAASSSVAETSSAASAASSSLATFGWWCSAFCWWCLSYYWCCFHFM